MCESLGHCPAYLHDLESRSWNSSSGPIVTQPLVNHFTFLGFKPHLECGRSELSASSSSLPEHSLQFSNSRLTGWPAVGKLLICSKPPVFSDVKWRKLHRKAVVLKIKWNYACKALAIVPQTLWKPSKSYFYLLGPDPATGLTTVVSPP